VSFNENGQIVLSESRKDYLQDPILKLLDLNGADDLDNYNNDNASNNDVSQRSTIARKYDRALLAMTSIDSVTSLDTQIKGGEEGSNRQFVKESDIEKKNNSDTFELPHDPKNPNKIILNIREQSRSTMNFLFFLLVVGFLLGVMSTYAMPMKFVLILFTVSIGFVFLLFINFKFEIEINY
jgi:hypothetical protein